MKISTLDYMLPKRWNLFFRYYLPFFKKPERFYFKCREFVNDLKKKEDSQDFPLNKLPDLLVILEEHSKNNIKLVEFSKKIIDTVIGALEESQLQILRQSLLRDGVENNDQTPVLNFLFNQLANLVSTNEAKDDIDTELNKILKNENIKDAELFLQSTNQPWSILIEKIIDYFYKLLKIEGTFLTKDIKEEDFSFQILNRILDNYKVSNERYPINIMQFLAITSLLNFSIDIEEINKTSMESTFKENFSIELQEFLAENRIKALKKLIQLDFIEKIHEVPTRDGGIRRKFRNFYNDNCQNLGKNPITELDLIIQKFPPSISELNENKINFIQKLFQFIYELLDSPLVSKVKNERFLTAEKARRDYEALAEERRELAKRIGTGKQTSVSLQCMQELFGEQALKMRNQWGKLGINFFNADNQVERQTALQEVAILKVKGF